MIKSSIAVIIELHEFIRRIILCPSASAQATDPSEPISEAGLRVANAIKTQQKLVIARLESEQRKTSRIPWVTRLQQSKHLN